MPMLSRICNNFIEVNLFGMYGFTAKSSVAINIEHLSNIDEINKVLNIIQPSFVTYLQIKTKILKRVKSHSFIEGRCYEPGNCVHKSMQLKQEFTYVPDLTTRLKLSFFNRRIRNCNKNP